MENAKSKNKQNTLPSALRSLSSSDIMLPFIVVRLVEQMLFGTATSQYYDGYNRRPTMKHIQFERETSEWRYSRSQSSMSNGQPNWSKMAANRPRNVVVGVSDGVTWRIKIWFVYGTPSFVTNANITWSLCNGHTFCDVYCSRRYLTANAPYLYAVFATVFGRPRTGGQAI